MDSLLEEGVWSEPVSESGRGITAQFQNVYGSYWKAQERHFGPGSAGILIFVPRPASPVISLKLLKAFCFCRQRV